MDYSILKDDIPSNTVKKIKNILNKVDISLKEEILDFSNYCKYKKPVSVRLKFAGSENIGTNGKGTSVENALASGYAEFMERLQNNCLFSIENENFYFAPDEVFSDFNEIITKDLENVISGEAIKLIANSKTAQNNVKFVTVPFYYFKDKNTKQIPVDILSTLAQGTNGMAAGNTMEEALVQGFSEVCERYALGQIISGKIAMPLIPRENYIKYDNISDFINYYEANGYKVIVKDASLGKNFPVVCTVFEDTIRDIFYVKFAANLSLPVAIERCFTEFAQGFNIAINKSDDFFALFHGRYLSATEMKYLDSNSIIEILMTTLTAFEHSKEIDEIFFSNKSDYNFSYSPYLFDNNKLNNKTMLKVLYKVINRVAKNEIYVRNVSYLGFPSVYIFIPNMTVFHYNDVTRAKEYIDYFSWIDLPERNKIKNEKNIYSLFNALEYSIKIAKNLYGESISKSLPEEYIALLCAVLLKRYEKIDKYTDIILNTSHLYNALSRNDNGIKTIKMIREYFGYHEMSEAERKEKFEKKYSKEDIDKFYLFINNISFDIIKKLIKRPALNKSKKEKVSLTKEKFQNVVQKLAEAYKKNLPEQMNLKKYFDFTGYRISK